MRVLIIGSGGREHSLFTKLVSDPQVSKTYMLGENGGVAKECIFNIDGFDFNRVYAFIKERKIDLTIVGPEAYLQAGIVDYLQAHNCKVIGPDKYCTQLESSKNFAKKMMKKANVPTAKFKYVTDVKSGLQVASEFDYPIVLKFDRLAAGKGVAICKDETDANNYLVQVLEKKCFGEGGIVVEECLVGEEYSVFAVVNGENYSILPIAQDYKRAYDDDLGPNTGGMGAYTTAKFDNRLPFIEACILQPILKQFILDGYKYSGFIYIGLMETKDGPKVIEFNVRMGDPETEIVMQKLDSSLIEVIQSVYSGENYKCDVKAEEYIGVVLAAKGYPSSYEKNVILDINEKMRPIFHMGSKISNGTLISTGGRIIIVTASGENIAQARASVYSKLEDFNNHNIFYRSDIGLGRI